MPDLDTVLIDSAIAATIFVLGAVIYRLGYSKGWNDLRVRIDSRRKPNVYDIKTKQRMK